MRHGKTSAFTLVEILVVLSTSLVILLATDSVIKEVYSEMEETLFISSLQRFLHQAQLNAILTTSRHVWYEADPYPAYHTNTQYYYRLSLPIPKQFVKYSSGLSIWYCGRSGYTKMRKLVYETKNYIYVFQYQLGSGHFKCIKKGK